MAKVALTVTAYSDVPTQLFDPDLDFGSLTPAGVGDGSWATSLFVFHFVALVLRS